MLVLVLALVACVLVVVLVACVLVVVLVACVLLVSVLVACVLRDCVLLASVLLCQAVASITGQIGCCLRHLCTPTWCRAAIVRVALPQDVAFQQP